MARAYHGEGSLVSGGQRLLCLWPSAENHVDHIDQSQLLALILLHASYTALHNFTSWLPGFVLAFHR
jgi:hypothetical protein